MMNDMGMMTFNSALEQEQNSKFVHVITKQSILGISVAVLSGSFSMSIFIADGFNKETNIDLMISYTVRAMEGVLVSGLLYIGLYINEVEYKKICGLCHKRCYEWAAGRLEKTVAKGYYLMEDDELENQGL